MFVHAQDLHVLEPGRGVRGLDQDWPNLGPERVPRRAELAGQALDRRPLAPELADRPADRARAQQAPRRADPGSCSTKVLTAQTPSRQIQRRLHHRIRTGRPAHRASITSTTTRP